MATIVTFVPRAAAIRSPLPPGTTGSVVFFTGVRYEKPEAGSKAREGAVSIPGTTISKPN